MTEQPSLTNPPGKRSWRDAVRGNVLAMGLVSLFTDASSEMINPLLPIFITGLVPAGLAAVYVGLMAGITETVASVLKIFSGRISDRLGKRKALVIVGYGISTICRPLMALAGVGWHLIALKFGDRVGKGIRTGPRDALIGDSVGPEHRGLAFSFHRVMDHTGAIIGAVLAVLVLFAFLGNLLFGVLWKYFNDVRPGLGPQVAFSVGAGLAGLAAVLLIVLLSVTSGRKTEPAVT